VSLNKEAFIRSSQSRMGRIFSWEYFSFLQLDNAVAYKEVLIIPCLLLVLSFVWMQLVRGETSKSSQESEKDQPVNFVEAYQDALLNEVDSGTELDSQNEDDDDEKKKEMEEEEGEQSKKKD